MTKQPRPPRQASVRVIRQRTVIYPVVEISKTVKRARLTDAQFELLEQAGGKGLTAAARRNLENIAQGWVDRDVVLQSARPNEFRRRLDKARRSGERVIEAVDFYRADATTLD